MRKRFGLGSLILAVVITVSSLSAQQASKESGPAVTFVPEGLDFGNQPVGIRSAVRTVTLTNSGTQPLTIVRIFLSSTDYSQTHDCPASLPAGESCTLSVTFLPTGLGTRASVVRIDDNTPGSPHRLGLTGAGITSATEQRTHEAAEADTRPERIADAPTPDTRPLSGAEDISVGLRHGARNYVLPSLQLNVSGDSNQTSAPGGTRDMEMRGSVVARLALQHVTRKSQLTLDYMGGGLFYSRDSDLNTTMHQFGITQSVRGRRWGLMLSDRASYLPESSFGFSGFGGMGGFSPGLGGSFGSTLGNLNPTYTPNQSIFSGRG
ncbi:MAG: choice-of-anchor D domain-containing protein, partial [Burkholderiales bacterium]